MSANEEKKQLQITIVNMFPVPAREPDRFGEQDYLVICRTADNRVITVRIPAKELTLERIREEVLKELRKLTEYVGKSFTVEIS